MTVLAGVRTDAGDPPALARDDMVVADRTVVGEGSCLAPAVDLRPCFDRWGLDRSRQGERPTCSVFTVVGALEYALGKRQGTGPRLSVEFLNWAANQAAGDAADGAFFSDLWKGFERHGICLDERMPYRPKGNEAAPPSPEIQAEASSRLAVGLRFHWIKEWDVHTGLTDAQLLAIRRTLNAGWPVCGGFRWPQQERWVDEVLQMCSPDAVRDGHSVLLVGYREDPAQPGGGVLLFRNTSRDGRDGSMPYAYAQAYMNDAAWVE
ncbi:MAG: hypothetical protein HS113_05425 [Verrucomicrobiales bacterium]|nr:hypothetical protein [Verrucomicrobiales bacterium]